MKRDNKIVDLFFELLRSGLWEQDVALQRFESLDFESVYKLAYEQTVEGLVASGLNHVVDMRIDKAQVLSFMKRSLGLEKRNKRLDDFIARLVQSVKKEGLQLVLMRGQAVARCYSHPEWRTPGDIDFLLAPEDYTRVSDILSSKAESVEIGEFYTHDTSFTFKSLIVELHGTLRCGLSSKMDRVLDGLQQEILTGGHQRIWDDDGVEVFLPEANIDTLLIFTHFLKHFYKGGVGLRQICDWCRVLWAFRDTIDRKRLEDNLRRMRILEVWKGFAAYAVTYLGMPVEAMPLYDSADCWKRKADRIHAFLLEVGNMGNLRDMSYYGKYPFLVRKTISLARRVGDLFRHASIFPVASLRFFPKMMFNGLRSAALGEG